MLRFVGKQFYWIAYLWPVGLLALMALGNFPVEMARKRGLLSSDGQLLLFIGLVPVTAFFMGLLLTLARRRAGFSAQFLWRFFWVVVLQAAFVVTVLIVWYFTYGRSWNDLWNDWALVRSSIRFVRLTMLYAICMLLAGFISGTAATLGGLIGLGVARVMFRMGRWPTQPRNDNSLR